MLILVLSSFTPYFTNFLVTSIDGRGRRRFVPDRHVLSGAGINNDGEFVTRKEWIIFLECSNMLRKNGNQILFHEVSISFFTSACTFAENFVISLIEQILFHSRRRRPQPSEPTV